MTMAEYIDREEYCEKHCRCSNEYCDRASCPLWKAPAADVAPVVHARWVKDEEGEWSCTNCRETVAICDSGRERTYRKPYCPNCGAKMDGESPC